MKKCLSLLLLVFMFGCTRTSPSVLAQKYVNDHKLGWGAPERVVTMTNGWIVEYPVPPNTLGTHSIVVERESKRVYPATSRWGGPIGIGLPYHKPSLFELRPTGRTYGSRNRRIAAISDGVSSNTD